MVKDGNFVIPMVRLGNLVLLPEPSRGWSDDPMKLYHDPTVYPHHQYIAAYLWVQHQFAADAMIHLGTHATYEWLPGKQAGLLSSDPPEIMTGHIPNIYPYIVDDVGEGIQAKRRGRGVIIDHLTPALKDVELHDELSELHDLLSQYEINAGIGGATAAEYLSQIATLLKETGIAESLEIDSFTAEDVEKVDLYLHEVDTGVIPFGLHTFGTGIFKKWHGQHPRRDQLCPSRPGQTAVGDKSRQLGKAGNGSPDQGAWQEVIFPPVKGTIRSEILMLCRPVKIFTLFQRLTCRVRPHGNSASRLQTS